MAAETDGKGRHKRPPQEAPGYYEKRARNRKRQKAVADVKNASPGGRHAKRKHLGQPAAVAAAWLGQQLCNGGGFRDPKRNNDYAQLAGMVIYDLITSAKGDHDPGEGRVMLRTTAPRSPRCRSERTGHRREEEEEFDWGHTVIEASEGSAKWYEEQTPATGFFHNRIAEKTSTWLLPGQGGVVEMYGLVLGLSRLAGDAGRPALGVFAARDIDKGMKVAAYTGDLKGRDAAEVSAAWSDRLLNADYNVAIPRTNLVICPPTHPDPQTHSISRFANHSCDPNSKLKWPTVARWWAGKNASWPALVALRDIEIGTEITWDYEMAMAMERPREGYWCKCKCGALGCRGGFVEDGQGDDG